VLHALERATAGGSGSLARPLARIAQSQQRRGIFLLLSDLYEPVTDVLRALGPLTGAGHDVIVIHSRTRRHFVIWRVARVCQSVRQKCVSGTSRQ
jgi:hypothetical protein